MASIPKLITEITSRFRMAGITLIIDLIASFNPGLR